MEICLISRPCDTFNFKSSCLLRGIYISFHSVVSLTLIHLFRLDRNNLQNAATLNGLLEILHRAKFATLNFASLYFCISHFEEKLIFR